MFTIPLYKCLTLFLVSSALILPRVSHSQTMASPYHPSSLHLEVDDAGSGPDLCGRYIPTQITPNCDRAEVWMSQELSSLGPRGELIAGVREQTLQILQSGNACKAWFEEADPDAADVFRSLHYDIDLNGTASIYSITDNFGDLLFKHPWGARSVENSGRNSFIELNGNGPFFVRKTRIVPSEAKLAAILPNGPQAVLIGPYEGATPEAQITILLHELGHIVGRLPRDDNSWNGRSSDNTRELLRHCKKDIRQAARREVN
jgi:hypothetical protein